MRRIGRGHVVRAARYGGIVWRLGTFWVRERVYERLRSAGRAEGVESAIGSAGELVVNIAFPLLRRIVERKLRRTLRRLGDGLCEVDSPYGRLVVPLRRVPEVAQVVAENVYGGVWDNLFYRAIGRARSGEVVVDCGAAEGFFSLAVRKEASRVIAVEPDPEWVACLGRTFNGDQKVEVIRAAAGRATGEARLRQDGIRSRLLKHSEQRAIIVPVMPLDEIVGTGRCDLIKMDVEGYEEEVLEGAARTIRRCKPRLVIAVYHDENDVDRIVRLLRSLWQAYTIVGRGVNYKRGGPKMLFAF